MLTIDEYRHVLQHDLNSFVERSFYELNPQTRFVDGPHIQVINSKLEACRRGDIKRLIINLPPRHLKSHCASIAFPAWFLAHRPSSNVICVSYGQDLADKLARDSRTLMQAAWFKQLFPVRLSDKKAVDDFMTMERGCRMSTSVGGVLTGRGADLIIIDDPLKPDEALSDSGRKAVNEWYDNTLLSRLNDKANGCIIIIMQRLHQDDLVGHVLEQEDWDVLSFPAIADEDQTFEISDALGTRRFSRTVGEPLHPARETLATLKVIKHRMGDYNFSAQYQQNPTPREGAMVKTAWLQFYDTHMLPKRFTGIVQSWDTANKTSDLNDYSVCTTWGTKDGRYYLLDVFRKRLNYPQLKRAVCDLKAKFSPISILIEDKASGTQLIQDLKHDGVLGIKPYEPPSGTDKTMRLHLQTTAFENGLVHLPKQAAWLSDYVAELTTFPGTKFDDQVDSTTQALAHLQKGLKIEMWARLGQ